MEKATSISFFTGGEYDDTSMLTRGGSFWAGGSAAGDNCTAFEVGDAIAQITDAGDLNRMLSVTELPRPGDQNVRSETRGQSVSVLFVENDSSCSFYSRARALAERATLRRKETFSPRGPFVRRPRAARRKEISLTGWDTCLKVEPGTSERMAMMEK